MDLVRIQKSAGELMSEQNGAAALTIESRLSCNPDQAAGLTFLEQVNMFLDHYRLLPRDLAPAGRSKN